MKRIVRVSWDDGDIKSEKNAERMKTRLENQGYTLVKTRQVGLKKWQLVYEKEGKK